MQLGNQHYRQLNNNYLNSDFYIKHGNQHLQVHYTSDHNTQHVAALYSCTVALILAGYENASMFLTYHIHVY